MVAPPNGTFNDIHEPCTSSWGEVKGQHMPNPIKLKALACKDWAIYKERVQTPSVRVCPQ